MEGILHTEFILYVSDQDKSADFYSKLLRLKPALHVPGMTEFKLSDTCKIGLMPNEGIAKILTDKTPHPRTGNGIPRCELYLKVKDAEYEFNHAVACGAVVISAVEDRDWGDRVCYLADPDGHIIAFASSLPNFPL